MRANLNTIDSGADPNDPAFHPFQIGALYLPKIDFTKGSTQFQAGAKLRFISSGYGAYDNAIVYQFEAVDSGEQLQWWLWSNEPNSLWRELFAEA